MGASNNSTIPNNLKSITCFYTYSENSFLVVDENTVVGIQKKKDLDSNVLILENMKNRTCLKQFGGLKGIVNSLIFSKAFNCILVCDNLGKIVQYTLENIFLSSPKVVKKYPKTKINNITSLAIFGGLAAVGGFYKSSFVLLDLITRKFVTSLVKTCILDVTSLQFCPNLNNSKVLLVVSGMTSSLPLKRTDVFDITNHCLRVNANFQNPLNPIRVT